MSYFDFNSADEQTTFDLIPKGTLVKVCTTCRPGGYDDPTQGWTGGIATRSDSTGSVYLNLEFTVMEGPYARRKLWSRVGLYSPKGPEWANMGRMFIKAMLNSARGVNPSDSSPAAQNARRITGFADLEGMIFIGRVDWERDQNGQDRAVIKAVITPDHKEYAALMGTAAPVVPANAYVQASGKAPVSSRPSWAQ